MPVHRVGHKTLDICSGEKQAISLSVSLIDPLTAKSFILNFQPPESVSRWRDSHLRVGENFADVKKWMSTILKFC